MLTRTKISYVGYTKYQLLKGGKRKQKKWKQNRLKAYNGSQLHFSRSLRNKKLAEEGFLVHQFKRIINNNRPSNKQILRARSLVRKHIKQTKKPLNFRVKIINPITALDTALVIIQKSKLPKYRDYLYRKNVPYSEIIEENTHQVLLQFKDYLLVDYTKSPPEKDYFIYKRKPQNGIKSQISTLQLLSKNAILDPSGDIIQPLDIFVEGYWGYKQFADLLPLNYQPSKED